MPRYFSACSASDAFTTTGAYRPPCRFDRVIQQSGGRVNPAGLRLQFHQRPFHLGDIDPILYPIENSPLSRLT